MVPEIYSKIIGKLAAKAKRGEVDWKSTSQEGTFLVNFKEFSLAISTYYSDQEHENFVSFRLLDPKGKVIDYFTVAETDDEWGGLAFEMYSGARRKALRIDEALQVIGKELGVDDNDDVPF